MPLVSFLIAFSLVQAAGSTDAGDSLESHVRLESAPGIVRVAAGPVLLHARIEQQWGGHTFAYLLEGERGAFWSALAAPKGPVMVGQSPAPGSGLETRVTTIAFDEFQPTRVDQPLLLRTPDGTLHLFVGLARGADGHGDVRYLTSASPEDVSAFVDRSELIPRGRFTSFHHNRKNVGIDRRGERVALVLLTDFVEGRTSMNTPLLYAGKVEGPQIRFAEPVAFAEPTPFFYPQVAATDRGPVLLGAVDHDSGRRAELVHLDWEGAVLFRGDLPVPAGKAGSWAFEMEPFDSRDWNRLLIVRSIVPESAEARRIEFWVYDARTRELACLRSIENDVRTQLSITNAGQVWSETGAPPLFLNEPASAAVHVWEGAIEGSALRNEPLHLAPLPGTRTSELGLSGIRSVFVPSVLQGSLPRRGRRALALDADLACTPAGASSPCAWLLWWLERADARSAGSEFDLDSDFGPESAWMDDYLERCAAALVDLLDIPEVAPPRSIRVELRRDPDSRGIAGWAAGENSTIGFESAVWPRDPSRVWIVAHELTNLFVAHYAGGGGFPSDWWSDGRSPFAEYAACLVMRAAGEPEAADERRSRTAGQPDHDLYWKLHERHGFALFARFFRLLRADGVDLGAIEPPWPLPSGRRSLFTAAYLSLAAGENLAPILREARVGAEPPGWSEAHPDWPFTAYTIEDKDVEEVIARRRDLFESSETSSPELEARRASFRRGDP